MHTDPPVLTVKPMNCVIAGYHLTIAVEHRLQCVDPELSTFYGLGEQPTRQAHAAVDNIDENILVSTDRENKHKERTVWTALRFLSKSREEIVRRWLIEMKYTGTVHFAKYLSDSKFEIKSGMYFGSTLRKYIKFGAN